MNVLQRSDEEENRVQEFVEFQPDGVVRALKCGWIDVRISVAHSLGQRKPMSSRSEAIQLYKN